MPRIACVCLFVWRAELWASAPPVQDFGSNSVTAASSAATLSFTFSGLSAAPVFTLTAGSDFSAAAPACNSSFTTCSVAVNFAPLSPGLRVDALTAKDGTGKTLTVMFLRGVGLAPRLNFLPGAVTGFAGDGSWGYKDSASPLTASFRSPQGLAIDARGNIYVADPINQVIRKITAATGAVSTVAGNTIAGYTGDSGPATGASLNTPTDVAADSAGNLYIADQGNSVVRRVDAVTGTISTFAGGATKASGADGIGDGQLATGAILLGPNNVAVDPAGNLYISDSYHGMIRKVTAATGLITVFAGAGGGGYLDGLGDGGPAFNAILDDPNGIALDAAGNLYVADTGNQLVRVVKASTGNISVVAGNRARGYWGDGGPATSAALAAPTGVAVDAAGNVYIADSGNNAIRLLNSATGLINTIAGNGLANSSLANPNDLLLDSGGNLYICDTANNAVKKLSFSPPGLSFPSTNVGLSSPVSPLLLFNAGNASLTLASISLSAGFVQKPSSGIDCAASAVTAGAACEIDVSFSPTTSGQISGLLTVTSNNLNRAGSSQTVSLGGTAVGGSPQLSLSPTSLSFASQNVGTSSSAQSVAVSNTGSGPLTISNIWLSGSNAADFTLAATCPASLAAGSSCAVSIAFKPLLAGARTATLAFNDNATTSPQSVSISGAGAGGPVPTLSLTAVQFSNQTVGSSSAAQSIVLSNSGVAALNIFGIALTGTNAGDFVITGRTCGSALATGASCSISVGFSPLALGARVASLMITSSAGNSPLSASLAGTGIAPSLLITPASLTFASTPLGKTSAPQNVTLSNPSNASVLISSITIAGANSADFSIASTACGTTLAPAASCTISITLNPSGAGSRTASVSIVDSATGSPHSISLSGAGAAATQAIFQRFDTVAQGTWKGPYGSDGYLIANDSTNPPAYATVVVNGASLYTWLGSTTDVRALQKGSSSTDRIASAYYAAPGFTFDVNLTDGQSHQVAVYCLDYDSGGRSEKISILDASNGTVLDSQNMAAFQSGKYAVWNLQGHVLIQVTYTSGMNAVVSGLFFANAGGNPTLPPVTAIMNPAPGLVSGTVSLTASAVSTGQIASLQFQLDGSNLGASLTGTGPTYSMQWNTATASSGQHFLTAIAADTLGQRTTSNSVAVTIASATPPAPAVTITSPPSGAVSGAVTLAATATSSAGIASVQFRLDGVNLGTAINGAGPAFSMQWQASSASTGSHSITAIATDVLGQKTTSAVDTITVAGAPAAGTVFAKFDTTTAGQWKGVYGGNGYLIANDSNSPPSYALVSVSGAGLYNWSGSTTDLRALQKGASSSDRIASTYYSSSSFTFDVSITDGQVHQVALYAVDFDGTDRTQTISILDSTTNAVLDSQRLAGFHNGVYAVWNVQGHVLIRVVCTGGINAVVSGVFFGTGTSSPPPAPTPAPPIVAVTSPAAGAVSGSVTLTATATSTVGIASVQFQLDGSNLGSPVTATGPLFSASWNSSTATSGSHSLTAIATDTLGQKTTSSAVAVAVPVSGVTSSASATFVKFDTSTQGSWKSVYGRNGYIIANDSSDPPGFATVSVSGATLFTWSPSTTDVRALLKGASSTDRIASTYYSSASGAFTFDVNLTDGQLHQVAFYCLDLDTTTRAQQMSILDATSGAVLDTQNLANFHNGVYAIWNLRGHVQIRVTNTGGLNAVVSGLFF